jgi:hypothetical protein
MSERGIMQLIFQEFQTSSFQTNKNNNQLLFWMNQLLNKK